MTKFNCWKFRCCIFSAFFCLISFNNTRNSDVSDSDTKQEEKWEECDHCNGNGFFAQECATCDGSGRKIIKVTEDKSETCPTCLGKGIEPCINCGNKGYLVCKKCYGGGTEICIACKGTGIYAIAMIEGEVVESKCGMCHGKGYDVCGKCGGDGRIICKECFGEGHRPCSNCKGYKHPDIKYTHEEDLGECSKCNGSGQIKQKCAYCNGEGKIKVD